MPYIVTDEGLVIGGANPASQVPSPIYATRPLVVQPTGINPSPIITPPIVSQRPQIAAILNGADPSGKGGIPEKLLSMNVVESPVAQQSYTNSAVYVAFTRDTSDVNFDHVAIWFVGYHGSSTPTLMASGTVSPISFLVDTTDETVTVLAQTVSSQGLSAPLIFAIHGTVTLNGIISAPPEPTITQYVVATPTGNQFSFDQLVLSVGDEDVIASYNVYRNTSNSTSGATVIQTIKHNPANDGTPIVVQDTFTSHSGVIYYYWLTAVNTKGLESTKEACQTGTNTTYQPLIAVANVVNTQATISNAVSIIGLLSTFVAANTVYVPGTFTFQVVTTTPGNSPMVDVLLWASTNGSGYPSGYIFRFDTRISQNAGQIYKVANNGFTAISTYKAAANAAALPVGKYNIFCEYNADGTMNIFVNGVWQATATDTTYTPTGATYYGYENATGAEILPYVNNTSSFSSGELLSQGSISSAGNGTFSYTSTSSSITWTWAAFMVYNPDGSSYMVAANSSGTAFTGLTGSTTYYFDFYVTVATGVATVVISDVSSGTGMSSSQLLLQTVFGDGHVGIAWNVPASTPSSGSGGGSGHGGSGGACFTGETLIKTSHGDTPIKNIVPNTLCLTAKGTWLPVAKLVEHEAEGRLLFRLPSPGGLVTRTHKILHNGEWVNAGEVYKDMAFCNEKVYTLTMHSDEPLHDMLSPITERSFTLASGIVAHNVQPIK